MLKLKSPQQEEGAGRLPFEPMPDEPMDAYEMFAAFLASSPDHSPARFIRDRDLSLDEWIPIAGRYGWISRRVDYWNYKAVVQRSKWIAALDDYLDEFRLRMKVHYKRLEEARRKEEAIGMVQADYDRLVRTVTMEAAIAKDIVVALSVSTKESLSIVNNVVGAVNVRKDVSAIAAAWDENSKDIIEGVSKRKELKKGEEDQST